MAKIICASEVIHCNRMPKSIFVTSTLKVAKLRHTPRCKFRIGFHSEPMQIIPKSVRTNPIQFFNPKSVRVIRKIWNNLSSNSFGLHARIKFIFQTFSTRVYNPRVLHPYESELGFIRIHISHFNPRVQCECEFGLNFRVLSASYDKNSRSFPCFPGYEIKFFQVVFFVY